MAAKWFACGAVAMWQFGELSALRLPLAREPEAAAGPSISVFGGSWRR